MDVSAVAAAAAAAAAEGVVEGVVQVDVRNGGAGPKHFWEVAEPKVALAALEAEFSAAARAAKVASPADEGAWRDHFRVMFERECERHTRSGEDFEDPNRALSPAPHGGGVQVIESSWPIA
jgi:hypothetical protein